MPNSTFSVLHHLFWRLVSVFLLMVFFTQCRPDDGRPAADPDNGRLFLSDGFEAVVVADSVGRARHLAVRDNGDIYVKLSSSDPVYGGNVALRDTDSDGKADIIEKFGGVEEKRTSYGTTMTIHDGYLYFASALTLYRYKLKPGQLVPDGEPEIVLSDDHDHGIHWHITKPVAFDDRGYMYVPFGTPSNACQDLDATPNGAPGGAGIDPCPELEVHGGIWRFEAGKTGLTQKDGVRIATGIRSVVGMAWNPADEHLYVMMHGRDNLHSLFSNIFSPWQSAMLPAEELIRVEEGGNYGWPYCYYDHMQQKKVLAPEYGGDGSTTGRCDSMDLPVMGFPGHWAPNDLMFYRGDQFPERYKNGAFIAFHGSTNRAPYPQAGYFVCFVPFENGAPTGDWEVFADGFPGVDTIVNTRDARHRPVGLAEGPDGSLYITESNRGKIWRVMFRGDRDSFGAGQLARMEERKRTAPHIKTPHEIDDDLQRELAAGEKLYNTFCGTCHQQDGRGAPGRFPPLAGTKQVNGDKEDLIGIILNGLQGEIEVNGEKYNSVMPPHRFLTDEQIATILTFIRQNFGNESEAVAEEEVREIRGR